MRISDWSSDVCSSDLPGDGCASATSSANASSASPQLVGGEADSASSRSRNASGIAPPASSSTASVSRSEEHTSELQSLMRISYAVFCLKKKKINTQQTALNK